MLYLAASVFVVLLVAGCGAGHLATKPDARDVSTNCSTAYPNGWDAVPLSMRGNGTTMVPVGALWARECLYGMTGQGIGLVAREVLNRATTARLVADFNVTQPDHVPPGASISCGSDNGNRRIFYFAYPDGSVRAVLATTSGCIRLANGERVTLFTHAVLVDLGMLPVMNAPTAGGTAFITGFVGPCEGAYVPPAQARKMRAFLTVWNGGRVIKRLVMAWPYRYRLALAPGAYLLLANGIQTPITARSGMTTTAEFPSNCR